jgi:hypothetical protein
MGHKPVLAAAGALLAGVVMSGCESGRAFYDGPRSYLSSSGGMAYQQPGPPWSNQQRMASTVAAPMHPTSAFGSFSMKPEASVEQPAAQPLSLAYNPLQVTSSLQLVSGTAGSPNPTPMLTITLPAVKFLVPINGTYSYTPPQGTASAVETAAGSTTSHSGTMTSESSAMRVTTPAVPPAIQYTPPTVQYMVPATGSAPAPLPNMAGQAQPVSPTIQYVPVPVSGMGTKMAEETLPTRSGSMTPPAPSWPRSTSDAGDGAATELPLPPPPPIHRSAPATSAGPNSYYP